MTPQVTESEIKASYAGQEFAETYVERRFAGALFRLLHERQVQAVQRAITAVGARRILEIAPGPGRITRDIDFHGDWTCLEYNEGMISVGRAACSPRITWVEGDAFSLPHDGPFAEKFDLVYSFRFIRHFERADRARLYAQIRSVLAPGGRLVFDAVNALVSRPIREAAAQAYDIYDVLYESADQLRSELTGEGFEGIDLVPVQRRFGLQHQVQCLVDPRSRWLGRMLVELLERASGGPGLEWIVTCRRA